MNASRNACIGLVASMVASGGLLAQSPEELQGGVAAKLVSTCAGIRQGERVWVHGGTINQRLLEDLAIELRKVGAHPLVTLGSDRLTRRTFTDLPPRFDGQAPVIELALAENVDAVVTIDFSESPDLLADVPAARLAARAKAFAAVEQKLYERDVVQVNVGNGLYPTEGTAKQFAISHAYLERMFWKAVNTDYDVLRATGNKVAQVLASGKEVHVTANNGTDLRFEIARRPVFVNDGVITPEERYEGGPKCQVWLPAGEVYLAPVPGTARGTFIADNFFFDGKHIERLTLMFADGKLTNMSAKGDITALRERYDAAPEGRDVFAALDIGINPDIKAPTSSRLVTWVAAGTISIGIGNNQWAGGDNDVPYALFAHLPDGILTVDDVPLVQTGQLEVP